MWCRVGFVVLASAVMATAGKPAISASPSALHAQARAQSKPGPGILLEDLTWPDAEKVLTPETIVVIPIGAAAKEHGPHLRLKNDFVLAEYFTRRLVERAAIVVAPTVNYHFYPAFVEYPGSTSLRRETARDLLVDICRSLARFGPRRFYALNTGVSTIRALQPAADILATEGILFRFTDILKVGAAAEASVRQQEGGTHADEIETSMMLYMDPSLVDMSKAAKDYHQSGTGGLTRDPTGKGTYSPTGIWGDATLATREKGRIVVEAMVEGMVGEVAALAAAKPPAQVGPLDGASGYVSVGGVRLFYQIRGAGSWLLLLHGGLSSSAEFDAIIPELARHYRVLAIDRRGHGRSGDSTAPFAYATMATDVKAVVDALGVQSAVVLGFSDGGVVALHLASAHPAFVTRLVAIGAHASLDGLTPEVQGVMKDEMTAEALAKTAPAVEREYRARSPHPDAFTTFLAKSRAMWLHDPHVAFADLARIQAPTLVLAGEHDSVRLDHVMDIRRQLKNGRLCVLPGATHTVLFEQPHVVLPIILEFLK